MSQEPSAAIASSTAAPPLGETHRFALEHFSGGGRRLGLVSVAPDFQPAREWAYFTGVRQGLLPLVTAPAAGAIAPLWCEELGPPYCRGVRVMLAGADGRAGFTSDVSNIYFVELAREKAAEYVAKGDLAPGESYRYRLCAYPAETGREALDAGPGPHDGIGVEALAEPIALRESSLDELLECSELVGEPHELDAPVMIAREVLDETCALARDAGSLETGGVLVGRLHHDRSRPEVFAEVVAQIPARHAEPGAASFAFTPETWAAAHAAIELRGGGEMILGWWHSHPNFCRECPEERRRACVFARPFFSPEDAHLHRTCFPQAWQLALLVSDLPEAGPTPALFGWRAGTVVQRGFQAMRKEGTASPYPEPGTQNEVS